MIRRAVTGIRLARTDNGTDSNQILDNKVRDSGDGIVAFGAASSRIAGNTLSDLTGTGILCRDTFTSDAEIVGNRSVRNDIGIRLLFCGASVVGNIASENVTAGIFRTRSNGSTLANVANRNGGIGIHHDDSHGLIAGNVTNRNAGIGLAIDDQSPEPWTTTHGHGKHRELERRPRDHDEPHRRHRRRLQPSAAQRRPARVQGSLLRLADVPTQVVNG